MNERQLLLEMFEAATSTASPTRCLSPHLPSPPAGRTVVVGAGKAAAAMAAAVEACWPGDLSGIVVTRHGHGVPCRRITVVEAAHPVPDATGSDASRRILDAVRELGPNDLVLCLISGGGSALLTLPAPGLTLEDKRVVSKALLLSGAPISEINCVRKHLSAIKGGRLAAASRAPIVTLMISDVPGDDPSIIASGPTVADATTSAEALAVLRKYRIDAPPAVLRHLADPASETPKPGDPALARTRNVVIATPREALESAAFVAQRAGVRPLILGDAIEGEAREVALVHAAIARQCADLGKPAAAPCVLLSGGETTVTVRGKGRGGRNAEFLLALAVALEGRKGVHALAADTDGIDGTEHNAGAIIGPDTLRRAAALGIDATACLSDNDGFGFFSALGDLVVTGPTRTNVNDFRAVLVGAGGPP